MKQRKKFKPNGQAIKSPYFLTVCATSLEAGKRLQGECQRSVVYLYKKIELLFSFACKIVWLTQVKCSIRIMDVVSL